MKKSKVLILSQPVYHVYWNNHLQMVTPYFDKAMGLIESDISGNVKPYYIMDNYGYKYDSTNNFQYTKTN